MMISFRFLYRSSSVEFALQNGKSLDQPVKVFVRPDLAGVQHEGIFQLISFQHLLSFFGRMVECETFIQRIVDDGDLRLRQHRKYSIRSSFVEFETASTCFDAFHDSFRLQVTSIVLKFR